MSTIDTPNANSSSAEKLFALDIGTRSVVGIILEQRDEQFHVIDILAKEHKERAMVDGQIHNVLFVAQLIDEIKQELEKKHGSLTHVSVAAAGRALKTEQAVAKMSIASRSLFTDEDIHRLELQAVQLAQQQLVANRTDAKASHYYCVGYSVLYYRLDDDEIGSLLDQQGDVAEVEVIATFLPRVVVESLLAALKRANLQMEALTLEPIAAINVLIPPSMRRLNVALVDIGAGTSDIAITDKNTVIAYGMVPTAGDEITEALSDHYLLDFHVAEEAKRKITLGEDIVIQDILGFDEIHSADDVCEAIAPAITHLAKSISEEILRLNGIAPKAVMLIGGGSLTPRITEALSTELDLPLNRVAVRDLKALQDVTYDESIPMTPELVTPIGIAIAAKRAPIHYMSLTVNGRVVRLFEVSDMTVSDALLAANVPADTLYGKEGTATTITLNGQVMTIPGTVGEPATILINDEPASLKTIIKHNDVVTLKEGVQGERATVYMRDLLDDTSAKVITFQHQSYTVEPTLTINGQPATVDTKIENGDGLKITMVDTIAQFLTMIGQESVLQQLQAFYVAIDGRPVTMPMFSGEVLLNGHKVKTNYPLQHGDVLAVTIPSLPTAAMVAQQLNLTLVDSITVTFQKETCTLSRTLAEMLVDGEAVAPDAPIRPGARIEVVTKESGPWVYQDVFRVSEWQLPTTFKGSFTILRNNTPCSFDDPIFGGDVLEIQLQPVLA
ncbi:MAG: pilus assembly protein PilM [Caryophanon sp.]|nr:pilus assembly protein PilM [Caryophanon sp.]